MNRLFQSYKSVLTRKYAHFFALYFLFFVASGPLQQSISLVLVEKGFSERTLGFFLSFVSLTFIALPTFVSYLSSKLNAFAVGYIGMAISALAAFFLPLSAQQSFAVLIFCYIIMASRVIFNFSIGNHINLTIEDGVRARYFAVRDLFLFGSISIGMFIGSAAAARTGSLMPMYAGMSAAYILCILLMRKIRKNGIVDTPRQEAQEEGEEEKASGSVRGILTNRTFWAFALISVFTSIYGNATSFLPMLALSVGLNTDDLLVLIGILTLINALLGLLLGHLFDGKSKKGIYLVDLLVDALPALLFALTKSIPLFIAGYVLTMLKDSFAPISFAYYYECFDRHTGTMMLGMIESVQNAVSVVMPIIIGLAWGTSHSLVFVVSIAGIFAAGLVAWRMLPQNPAGEEK